jgi:chemotaxis protein MotB
MKTRRRNFQEAIPEENFWPSFTDLISTIALILFFLILLAYIQQIIVGRDLEAARREIDESNVELAKSEKQLELLQDDLERTMAEVEEGQTQLKLSERELEEQKEIIASSNLELGQLRAKLQGIALLRLDVLAKVKVALEAEIGTTNDQGQEMVLIASNGNIIINESLVFDYNSATVKSDGKVLIAKLADVFENILDDANVRDNIDSVNIQGHADVRGGDSYNRELSSKRAAAVVNLMMDSNPNLLERYGRYFAATGFSENRPIVNGTTEADYEQNRRIEISLVLKDSNIQDVIDEYLEETKVFLEQ